MVGGLAGSPRPAFGWVTILQGTTLVAKMQVDGAFTQILPSGTYTLTSTDGGPMCQSTGFRISPGRDTTAQVMCSVP
jgi:hypothetical protein